MDRAAETGAIRSDLSLEELVPIWDQLLMYYMLWLDGHTLVQTILCCLYLQEEGLAERLSPMPAFGAFVDALLLVCRTTRRCVLRAGIFDAEDFFPGLFGACSAPASSTTRTSS